ncbi:T9SS type B sorting domain-containing protein [Flavobacterium sp.]|uniref:DUF7948 domain-containing protein n=1 Tax=Flavobacterium sp. TaxID=239 RepID=UPI0026026261|nr:T9SS type B sorting domain-containing protein [Flavobacterium sp.]
MKFYYLFLLLFVVNSFSQNNYSSIGFIENKGQIIDQKGRKNNNVEYLLNTNGLNVQLRKNGFSYDIYETKKHPLTKKQKRRLYPSNIFKDDTVKNPNYTLEYLYHRIDIDFENSNQSVKLIGEEKSSDYDNYYNIPNEPNGIINVHKFKKVTYKNIYNNIDVVFFIPEDKSKPVEYNFIVNLGGKLSDIQLKFNGVKTELIDNKIKMQVRFGQMEETMPLSWSENGTDKYEIAIGYKKIKNNVYGFESSEDLNNKKVIIDPVPVRLWGTYYSGNEDAFSFDICNDLNNNVYISGTTNSTLNIATIGTVPQSSTYSYFNGHGFIVKFNSNGVRLFGFYCSVVPKYINVDSNENIYITGDVGTDAINISTPNSHQEQHTGFYRNAFLMKFNSTGIKEWGTYYGGNSSDYGKSICFDIGNNVYLAGTAGSLENIGTINTHQPNHAPGYLDDDGFIVKFSSIGQRIWGTYYGGNDRDQLNSINISNDGYIYVTGITSSLQNISTLNSYQDTINGYNSGIIAKFDLNGQRIWGSYFNGSTFCEINKSIIKDNYIYFYGITSSNNNLNTIGTFNETFLDLPMGFGRSSYVAKFDLLSQNLIWGTYFGEVIQDISINSNNNLFFHGCTDQTTGISTAGAYKEIPEYTDSYTIKLNENGQRIWGTYYGGNNSEGVNGAWNVNNKISIDSNNNLYFLGNTDSTNGVSTFGSHQVNYQLNSLGGLYNIYLAKFQDCISSPQISSNTPTCNGSSINLTASGGTNYQWTGPNGFTSNLQNPTITNVSSLNAGQYTCTITGTGGCDGANTINVIVGDNENPIPNVNPLPTIIGDCNTLISTPTATDNCAGIINATTFDPLSYSLPGTYNINWAYNDGNGNIETQVQTVTINPVALPIANSPQTFCIQQNATLNSIAISGSNIKWYDASTGGNLLPNSTILLDGTTYFASQTITSCESSRVPVLINIQNTPTPTGPSLQTFCSTQNPTLIDLTINGTNVIWYNSNTSTIPLAGTTNLTNGGIYYASQTINGCESVNRIPITVSLINTLNANNYSEVICDNLNDGNEIINLTTYNALLISNTSNCTFEYYNSFSGATNQSTINLITATNNYNLITGNHIIYVRIISNNGCHQIVELSLTLVNNPIISISDITPICTGNNITISAGLGFDTYSWSTGESSQSIVINQEGNYSVTVTKNNFGTICSTTKNFEVVLSNIATISNIETIDWTDNENIITVNIDSNSLGDYEYSLDGIHYQDSNVFNGLFSGQYSVYVRDKNGCGIVKKDIYLFSYPKYFTPNYDGINDIWKINFSEKEPTINIKIFDRFNKLLKNTSDNGWDGTYNGQLMPSDDYWFVITRANGKEYKGHFTLKR